MRQGRARAVYIDLGTNVRFWRKADIETGNARCGALPS